MASSTIPNTNGASYKSVSSSDFINLADGVSISNIEVAQYGRVITWRAVITTSFSSDTLKNIGTLKSQYRPKVIVPITSIIGAGIIGTDGTVNLANLRSSSQPYAQNWAATYVLA